MEGALLSGIAVSGAVNSGEVFSTVGKLSLFMIVALVIGILLVPRLLAYVARFESNEMLLITVLGLCFGFCLLVVKLEYSMVLGAFLIGAIMAESRQLIKIEGLIERGTGGGAEPHLVQGADRQAGRQLIGLRLVLKLQFEAEVAQRDADTHRAARSGAKLAPQIDGVRSAGAGLNIAAVAGAVDAELHELVVKTEHDRAGEVRRVRRQQFKVAHG